MRMIDRVTQRKRVSSGGQGKGEEEKTILVLENFISQYRTI